MALSDGCNDIFSFMVPDESQVDHWNGDGLAGETWDYQIGLAEILRKVFQEVFLICLIVPYQNLKQDLEFMNYRFHNTFLFRYTGECLYNHRASP